MKETKALLNSKEIEDLKSFMKLNSISLKHISNLTNCALGTVSVAFSRNKIRRGWIELAILKDWKIKEVPIKFS